MMPQMQGAIFGFESTLQFQIVEKAVTQGTIAESSKVKPVLWFEGCIQPMHSRDLLVKPEGERRWKWWTLWTDLELKVDWVVKDSEGLIYRVMAVTDWSQGDYKQYELIEGPGL